MASSVTFWPSAAACVAVWLAFRVYSRLQHIYALSYLPGPPTASRLWGDTFELHKLKVGTRYREWREKYGPTYLIREPLMEPVLVLGDVDGAAHVLNNTSIYWRPDIDKSILSLWFGESLLSTETDAHARRKKRLNPAFTPQSVMKVSPIFFDLAYRLKEDWDDKLGSEEYVVLNVSEALHSLSMNAISMTMFAHNLSISTGSQSIATLLDNITNGPDDTSTFTNKLAAVVINAFPRLLSLPNPMKRWADMLRTELGKIAQDVWDASERNEVVGGMDARVLEVLRQHNKGQEKASRDDAVAEIIGLLFAGSETVANVMGELLFELAHQPRIQTKLHAELQAFELAHGRAPAYSDLVSPGKAGLAYLEAVTQETLRCKAVLMDIARVATTADTIPLRTPLPGGQNALRVRAGQAIAVPVRDGVNVDPRVWGADAAEFRPERWLEPGVGAQGGMLTFGDGAKMCIGRAFALAELKIVISVLLRSFSFAPAPGLEDIDFYHLGGNTVKPKVRGKEKEGVQLPLCVKRV